MNEAKVDALRRIGLLSGLSDEALRRLSDQVEWRTAAPGAVLIERDADDRSVCFLCRGRVRVAVATADGRLVSFTELAAGDHFGELAALDGAPRSASVVALDDCEVAVMSDVALRALLAAEPTVLDALLRELTARIRALDERVVELSTVGAGTRVHEMLLALAEAASGAAPAEGPVTVLPPDALPSLASRCSLPLVVVREEVEMLERVGLVERREAGLVVLGVAALRQMVAEQRARFALDPSDA
jgi:CRP-like cAMP-binding protein